MALRIKELRIAAGLTQAELADLAGIERSQLSKIEREVEPANTRRLSAIAKALNVEVHQLFKEDAPASAFRAAIISLASELGDAERDAILAHARALAAIAKSKREG